MSGGNFRPGHDDDAGAVEKIERLGGRQHLPDLFVQMRDEREVRGGNPSHRLLVEVVAGPEDAAQVLDCRMPRPFIPAPRDGRRHARGWIEIEQLLRNPEWRMRAHVIDAQHPGPARLRRVLA
jgi:hypothetical protein